VQFQWEKSCSRTVWSLEREERSDSYGWAADRVWHSISNLFQVACLTMSHSISWISDDLRLQGVDVPQSWCRWKKCCHSDDLCKPSKKIEQSIITILSLYMLVGFYFSILWGLL
jgi:hypothetical protein